MHRHRFGSVLYCARCGRECPREEWRKDKPVDVDGEERRVWVHEPPYRLCGWRVAKGSKLAAAR